MDSYGGRISFMHPQNKPSDDDKPVVDDDEFPRARRRTGASRSRQSQKRPRTLAAEAPPRERTIEFEGADLDDSCPRLKVGDTVVFDVIENSVRRQAQATASGSPGAKQTMTEKTQEGRPVRRRVVARRHRRRGTNARSHREAHHNRTVSSARWARGSRRSSPGMSPAAGHPRACSSTTPTWTTDPRGRPAGGRRRLVPRR